MRVVLAGVPVDVHMRSVQHVADLRHELLLVRSGDEALHRDPDPRLAKLLDDIDPDGVPGAEARARSEAARRAGADVVDLELDLLPETADRYPRMLAALQEADELCREIELLTLAAPPDVARFRQWVAAEIVGQLTGGKSPERFAG